MQCCCNHKSARHLHQAGEHLGRMAEADWAAAHAPGAAGLSDRLNSLSSSIALRKTEACTKRAQLVCTEKQSSRPTVSRTSIGAGIESQCSAELFTWRQMSKAGHGTSHMFGLHHPDTDWLLSDCTTRFTVLKLKLVALLYPLTGCCELPVALTGPAVIL